MTYDTLTKMCVNKFKEYDVATCNRALVDCHATLRAQGEDIAPDYARKLWAEIDALRSRVAMLQRKA
jgi:hypothetical protein